VRVREPSSGLRSKTPLERYFVFLSNESSTRQRQNIPGWRFRTRPRRRADTFQTQLAGTRTLGMFTSSWKGAPPTGHDKEREQQSSTRNKNQRLFLLLRNSRNRTCLYSVGIRNGLTRPFSYLHLSNITTRSLLIWLCSA